MAKKVLKKKLKKVAVKKKNSVKQTGNKPKTVKTGVKGKDQKPNNLGDYLKTGGPGREKGSKNRFTQIRDIIAETFFDKEVNGKEQYRKKSMTKQGFRELMKDVVYLMPKETKLSAGGDDGGETVIIFRPAPKKVMAKRKIAVKKKGAAKTSGRRIRLNS